MITITDPTYRIPLTEWAAAGYTFNYNGHQIFVRSQGSPKAEALLLIHGFPTASWDWEAIWPTLVKHYHVLALDLIGFGLSAKPKNYAYSLMDQANLCEAYLKAEGVTQYHILAHDYGDSVAQELLARANESGERPKLLSVAFLNGGLFPETHRPVFLQKLLISPLGPLVAKMTSRTKLAQNLSKIFGPDTQPDTDLINTFWHLLTNNNGTAMLHKLINYMVERRQRRERWVGALQKTKLPLKVIDGAVDPVSGEHMVKRYCELVPNPNVTLLEKIGHYPQVEAPQEVLNAYMAFRGNLKL